VVGYSTIAAVRYYSAGRDRDGAGKVEAEQRVIENLPLYAVADDLEFVKELARSEYFGDDPAVLYDPLLKVPPIDLGEKPAPKQFDGLQKAYRALPSARRTEIVKLDQELFALEPRARDRYFRVLEAYAVWMERLPDAERRGVLTAATPALRLDVIRGVREHQWLERLPPPLRAKLDALAPKDKVELIRQWKEAEALRRDRLAFVRKHAEAFAANKSPWPFDTEAGRKVVEEFARDVLKVDDPKRRRITSEELSEYHRLHDQGQQERVWVWYGLLVYELAHRYPYLPEPADPKHMLTEWEGLPDQITRGFKGKGVPNRLKPVVGKWPEFPLQVHEVFPWTKLPAFGPQLGPARLEDFKPALRTAVEKNLFSQMSQSEKDELKHHVGRWPEYPRRLLHYAHEHDVALPGVTLPLSPRKWDLTYGSHAAPTK
jgi:hypothetical protein